MKISKDLKKLLVCGASLVMVASLGSGISNVSAKRVHHYHNRTARVYRHHNKRNRNSKQSRHARYMAQRKAQYKGLQHYLTWLNWYDGHHAQKMNTWKARHLYYFMNRLSGSQKRQLMNRLARINISAPKYYRTHFAKKNVKRNKRAKHMKRNKSVKRNKRVNHRVSRKHMNKKVRKHGKKRIKKINDKKLNKKTVQKEITKPNSNSNNDNGNNNDSYKNDPQWQMLENAQEVTDKDYQQYKAQQDAKAKAAADADYENMQKWVAHFPTKFVYPKDNDPYDHMAPVSAKVIYDKDGGDYAMQLTYADGTKELYDGFDTMAYKPNSLRNYYGYEKFAKSHPQEAYNWLMHPTNYNGVDDGEEASVGHDYTPVGKGIPYNY